MKMNIWRLLSAVPLIIPAIMSSACSESSDDVPQVDTKIVTNSSISFEAAGGSYDVVIQSSSSPTLTPSVDWLTVDEQSSTSKTIHKYAVVCAANASAASRNAEIVVEAPDFKSSISVTQSIGDVVSFVSAPADPIDGDGGSFIIIVNATSEPSASSTETWLAFEKAQKNDDGTYSIAATAYKNYTSNLREASIVVSCGSSSASVNVSQAAGSASSISGMPDDASLVATYMGVGWNLGNQLDSHNNGVAIETGWGNGACTQATMDAVRAAGFRTVRIPVTWLGKVGAAPDYTIDVDWLNRVAEVVGYAENAGLNAIINIHHDGADSKYWLNIKEAATNSTTNAAIEAQLKAMWTQIANKFADKGNFLIFELMNEIHDGGWGWGANRSDGGAQYKTLNGWLQVCVDAIRATGGKNSTRWIGVPGYVMNPDLTINNLVLPTDAANHLLVTVHFYDPNEYTLTAKYSEWGHNATSGKAESWGDESNVRSIFSKLKTKFIDNGVAVYIGEIGCVHRSTAREEAFRKYYLEYVCKAARVYGLPVIFWDNGGTGSGNEQSGLINHSTGAYINNGKEVVDVMVNAFENTDEAYTLESVYNKTIESYISE